MIDGLALGETTLPMIMIVTFVDFWAVSQLPFGLGQHNVRRDRGVRVTYFTFLPSFLFILAGGPLWNPPR